jgi:hypothetical protein
MSLFAQHTSGGAFIKPADLNGQLVIITNVAGQWPREFDTLRKAEVEIASFDYAVVGGPDGWQKGTRCNYNGINNKLGNIKGQPGLLLGRIGQATTNSGFEAWVLGAYTPEDEAAAAAWLQANPAPSPFAAQSSAPAAAPTPVQAAPPAPVAAPPATAPVAAPAQYTPEQLQAMLAQLQGAPQ